MGYRHMLDPVGYHSIERGSEESHCFPGGVTETEPRVHATGHQGTADFWGMLRAWMDLGCFLRELGWVVVFSVMGYHSIDIYGLQTHVGPCGIPFYRARVRRVALLPRRGHRDLSGMCLPMVLSWAWMPLPSAWRSWSWWSSCQRASKLSALAGEHKNQEWMEENLNLADLLYPRGPGMVGGDGFHVPLEDVSGTGPGIA